MHDEVEFKYYDGGSDWVKVSNDEELATMFAEHKEKEQFHVRLQNDVVVSALGPRMADAPSRAAPCRRDRSSSQKSSGSARGGAGSTSVGSSRRVPVEVEPDDSNRLDEEERLYSDVVQNLRRSRVENQDEGDAVGVDEDNAAVDEDEDVVAVEWDSENPHMEDGSIFHQ